MDVGVGGSGSGVGWFTNFKFSNRIEISWFVKVLSCSNIFGGPPWGRVGWVGVGVVWVNGAVATNLKSSNRIVISWFVKFLLIFGWLRSPPFGRWGGWMVVGLCQGVWGVHHACVHVHAHAHTCAHTWAMMSYRDCLGFPYGSSHLHEIIMFIHVCMCGAPPKTPWQSPTHIHPPNGGTPEISQKSIKIEQIKIFKFCLKNLDLWTFVHYTWCAGGGCPITNSVFYF